MDWTTGMDYWTDRFALKIIFMAYNKSPLPVKLHPALDQSVIVSSISLHKTIHIFKIRTREGSLHVSNLCEGSNINSSIPKPLGGRWGSYEYKVIT